jgi:hypothetical protein
MQAATIILPTIHRKITYKHVMATLEQHRLLAVIFRHHLEAKEELTERIQSIFAHAPDDKILELSHQAIAQTVVQYFNRHIMTASAEAISNSLKQNLIVLRNLQDNPTQCMKYYRGEGLEPGDIPHTMLENELALKAALIESSIKNPSPPPVVDFDKISDYVTKKYLENGYSTADLANLEQIHHIDPQEGCEAAIKFYTVLASLPSAEAGTVLKNLMALSQNASP